MHIIMVKKTLADGSDCRKCADATEQLRSRGLWDRIDEIVWAHEADPTSPGMVLGRQHGVESAPFFIVTDQRGQSVYTSVLQLVREKLGRQVSDQEQALAIDAADIGGI